MLEEMVDPSKINDVLIAGPDQTTPHFAVLRPYSLIPTVVIDDDTTIVFAAVPLKL